MEPLPDLKNGFSDKFLKISGLGDLGTAQKASQLNRDMSSLGAKGEGAWTQAWARHEQSQTGSQSPRHQKPDSKKVNRTLRR